MVNYIRENLLLFVTRGGHVLALNLARNRMNPSMPALLKFKLNQASLKLHIKIQQCASLWSHYANRFTFENGHHDL